MLGFLLELTLSTFTHFDCANGEIVVYEVDETAYLSKSEANRDRLLQAIKNVENGTNLAEVSLEAFDCSQRNGRSIAKASLLNFRKQLQNGIQEP